jgi:uncharacterized protein (TIGR04255 family)
MMGWAGVGFIASHLIPPDWEVRRTLRGGFGVGGATSWRWHCDSEIAMIAMDTGKRIAAAMDQDLPSFKKPPVIETAISVQFKPVEGFTNAHLGLFWDKLRGGYPKVADAEPIASQVELFGDQVRRKLRLPSFQIVAGEAAARLQMTSEDDQMMVQVQNGRLVFNWRGMSGGPYPRWCKVLPEFESAFGRLRTFLPTQGLPDLEPNQWEVTYVNHLRKGRDWEEPADWPKLLPGLIGATGEHSTGTMESIACGFRFALAEDSGRLHVDLHHGYAGLEQDAPEILVLQLTARGGVDAAGGRDISTGLAKGRSAIVRKFTEVTGPDAHKKWERER